MIVKVINQPDIIVSDNEAKQLANSMLQGSEFIVIRGEMIRASAISGIRTDSGYISITTSTMRSLAAGDFNRDRREAKGKGYEAFQALRRSMWEKRL